MKFAIGSHVVVGILLAAICTVVTASPAAATPIFECNIDGPYTGVPGEEILLTGTIEGGAEPYTYAWDFGDGNTQSGDVTDPMNVQGSNTYSTAATYTVQLLITDNTGGSTSCMTTVEIVTSPAPPGLWGLIKALFR